MYSQKRNAKKQKHGSTNICYLFHFEFGKKSYIPFVNVITDVTLNGKMTQRESKK